MKTKISKAIAIALLSILSFEANSMTIGQNVYASDIKSDDNCGVSSSTVIEYMRGFGVMVSVITPVTGSCNVRVKDTTGKNYMVYIQDGQIVGHDDIPL